MTYDHMVKVDGKWFGVGDEVNTSLPASVSVEKTVELKTETKAVAEPKKPATKRSTNKGSKK